MANFRYSALTATGTPLSGEMEAVSEVAVIHYLRTQGHYPISASPAGREGWRRLLPSDRVRAKRASLKDLSIATQVLATLLKAGLELDRALGIAANLGETKTLHRPLAAVRARVRDGESFGEALAAEDTFPALYVSTVRAGELGGQLDKTLLRLAEYLQRGHAVREAVASALVYPIILLCTAGFSIIVILIFVLPQFEPLFAEAGRTLPLSTRVVMGIGHFIGSFWWLIAFASVAGVRWLRRRMRLPAFRRRMDALLLKLPLFGELLRKIDMERFSRTLGTLITNGVALPNALAITKDVLANSVIAEAVGETSTSLREGDGLAARLARSKQFPAITLDLIQVGEESGTLDQMLLRQAELCEQAVKHTIDRLIALLVPILTVVLGLMVAGLIASMLVAILSVNDLAV